MIAKDGMPVLAVTGILTVVMFLLYWLFPNTIMLVVLCLALFLFVFSLFFLRDPDRETPSGENLIISPADGTVIKVDQVEETDYFAGKVQRVSIFMSVFNVHVNRVPVSGIVDYLEYEKGKFLAAFADDASDHNERSIIGISSARGKILFKQIAGLIARRIVFNLNKSDSVVAGERFGLIRYGSRVDIYMPLTAKIHVKLKDKVQSGKTIIGEF
ncbi:MAG: phosphatidylserine decarboxylase family protein [Calditrichae bacterium]|nr:phosphatidylserine decarboxylase family protein [Calditrichota bacterium]MCB9059088.1 phosphatidylserine decarboxylase family protein [Calditrichia bacterium]